MFLITSPREVGQLQTPGWIAISVNPAATSRARAYRDVRVIRRGGAFDMSQSTNRAGMTRVRCDGGTMGDVVGRQVGSFIGGCWLRLYVLEDEVFGH